MPLRLKPFIPEKEIHAIIKRVSSEIGSDFASGEGVLVGVLKGAFVFLADLARELGPGFEVDFIQASSYGKNDAPSQEVRILKDITADIKGRDVIVVEGIIDRGITARAVVEHLKAKGPSSIRVCTLILRDGNASGVKIDYAGKRISDGFVVGYGMDYMEMYRGLKEIYMIDKT